MPGRVKGKNIIVTGGSSGIGLATVVDLVSEGAATVIIAGDNPQQLKEAATQVKQHGDAKIITHHFDVTDPTGWDELTDLTNRHVSTLDVLVNNAGINKRDSYQECTLEDWKRIIEVNQTGTFLGMKSCIKLLKKSNSASIVNLSSITGLTGYFAVAYSASKWAIRGMTKSAAMEFSKWKIRANSVHPGFIETPLNEDIYDLIQETNIMNPAERAGKAQEVAKAVTFLASEDASYINGTEIVIDGGLTSGGQFKHIGDKFNLF